MTHTIIGKGLFLCFMLAIVALVAGCAMVPRDVEVPEARTPYILGVGDVLHITVYGQDGLTGDFRVDAKGNISYPLINTIQVAGFTTTDIAPFTFWVKSTNPENTNTRRT